MGIFPQTEKKLATFLPVTLRNSYLSEKIGFILNCVVFMCNADICIRDNL